jgi:biopolymer transport protein ExbD
MKVPRRKVAAEIPTASMADIAFLLIIFFMLTAAFAAIKGINFGLPPDDPKQIVNVRPEQALHIRVLGPSDYRLNDQPIRIEDLGPAIKGRIEQNKNTPVIIDTEPEAPFEAMIAAFDEAKLAGATRISLPTPMDRQRWRILSGQ